MYKTYSITQNFDTKFNGEKFLQPLKVRVRIHHFCHYLISKEEDGLYRVIHGIPGVIDNNQKLTEKEVRELCELGYEYCRFDHYIDSITIDVKKTKLIEIQDDFKYQSGEEMFNDITVDNTDLPF